MVRAIETTNTKLHALKKVYDLDGIDNIAIDQINTVPITIKYGLYNRLLQIYVPFSDSLVHKKIEEELKINGIKASVRILKNQAIRVNISIKRKEDLFDKYSKLKSLISTILNKHSISLPCVYCQNQGGNIYVLKDDIYSIAHSYCHIEYVTSLEEKCDKGSWVDCIKGGFGALLGALLPLALGYIMLVEADRLYAWLYIFSAPCAMVGYEKMKGAIGYKSFIIMILSSCFAFLIYVYAKCIYVLYVFQAFAVLDQLPISGFFRLSHGLIFSEYFFTRFGFEILFFLIGLVIAIIVNPLSKKSFLKRQAKNEELTKTI